MQVSVKYTYNAVNNVKYWMLVSRFLCGKLESANWSTHLKTKHCIW